MDVAVAYRRQCSMKSIWVFVRVSEAGQGGVSPVDPLLVSGQLGERPFSRDELWAGAVRGSWVKVRGLD